MLLVQTQIPTDFHRSCSVFFGMVNPVTSSIRFHFLLLMLARKHKKKPYRHFATNQTMIYKHYFFIQVIRLTGQIVINMDISVIDI